MWNMNDEKYSMNIFMNMSCSMRNVIRVWNVKYECWTV